MDNENKAIIEFLKRMKINPHNLTPYEEAFTHCSYSLEKRNYEKLEFLGDSVIGSVVAILAYLNRPELDQGGLTKLRIALVQTASLARYARSIQLQSCIRVGKSFADKEFKNSDHILEDIFESLVGAIYLDCGYLACYRFIRRIFIKDIKTYNDSKSIDYKSHLQEEMQSEHRNSVTYKLVKSKGPSHSPVFEVDVLFNGVVLGHGSGKSKKEAEQMAAKEALSKKAV